MKIHVDEVESVSSAGIVQTFDVSVSDNHNFVLSNDILSHNSGKSTGAISVGKYVSMRTGVKFTPKHVCPNEQYYIDLVKVAVDNQFIVVDEQLETHVGMAQAPSAGASERCSIPKTLIIS